MSKFVIECPNCGNYAQAKTGFFARKKVTCSCGHVIDVRTERMKAAVCERCGNSYAFDLADGDKAKCPVCGEPVSYASKQVKTIEFACGQCGVRLRCAKDAALYTCPVCDHVNDVAERVEAERIREEGLASVLKFDGDPATLVWKHPLEDFNMGTQLIVHEGQEAVFLRDGEALQSFTPGRYALDTAQIPVLEKLYVLPLADGAPAFHSEVYFVSTATQMAVKWGTDTKVRLFDPMSGMHLELGASGEFNIRVVDARRLLIKLIGTGSSMTSSAIMGGTDARGFFRTLVMSQVKAYLAQAIKDDGIPVLEIDAHLMELSDSLRALINERLDPYGLSMPDFFVSRVCTPDDDPAYQRMRELFAQRYIAVTEQDVMREVARAEQERRAVEAETEARLKVIGAQGEAQANVIEAQARAEAVRLEGTAAADAYRAQAAAEAAEMAMKGYTYQQETSRMVGMEALQNGITGNAGQAAAAGPAAGQGLAGGASSVLGTMGNLMGDVAGLGVALGAMGGVMNMAKDALTPMMEVGAQLGKGATDVASHAMDATADTVASVAPGVAPASSAPMASDEGVPAARGAHFSAPDADDAPSGDADAPERPAAPATWDCTCGEHGLTGNFCPNCGARRM